MPAVPTIISSFWEQPPRVTPPRTLRYILSGGTDCLWISTRGPGNPGSSGNWGYGLTEAASGRIDSPRNRKQEAGSVGTLLSCVEAEIRNDEGEVLPAGSEGHLWIRGDNVAKCYYRNPELTSQRFVDGWFDTCDIAKFDDDGYLYLVGRRTEVIFVGGFKVYAQEVEKVLLEHPAVAEAAVIGVPRSISGEINEAFIVLKKDEKATSKGSDRTL